jgi:dual specificity protein phosphatase-like protein
MDISFITDFGKNFTGWGMLYQAAAPDDGIITFQAAGRRCMLIEMAAGVNALQWVRQGTLKSVLYFGIDDSPDCCLEDDVLMALARMSRAWLSEGGDIISGCGAGISRSSYASCAILMLVNHYTFDQALAVVRSGRPQANPNSGFVAQLQSMQEILDQS